MDRYMKGPHASSTARKLGLMVGALLATPVSAAISVSGTVSPAYNGLDDPWSTGSASIEVGFIREPGFPASGSLIISEGSGVATDRFVFAPSEGSSGVGTIEVTGVGSQLSAADGIGIGGRGDGELRVLDGARIITERVAVGLGIGSTAVATVRGTDSHLDLTGDLIVGSRGNGRLHVAEGAQLDAPLGVTVGSSEGASGTAIFEGAGTFFQSTSDLVVGGDGKGVVILRDGASASTWQGILGAGFDVPAASGVMTVTGSGSNWGIQDDLVIGDHATGSLRIADGAVVEARQVFTGYQANSRGILTVEGEGSVLASTDGVWIGYRLQQNPNDTADSNDGFGNAWIRNGGLIKGGLRILDGGDSWLRMSSGGQIAISDRQYNSLEELFSLGNGGISPVYWRGGEWAPLTEAVRGVDYTLEYATSGELANATVLTVLAVPEPTSALLLFAVAPIWLSVSRSKPTTD